MPKKSFKEILSVLVNLLKEHHDPHGVALGVAIGSFIGILPLYGLHTVLCIVVLFLMPRANKLAIILGTNISIPPTVVTITWTAYDVGRLVLIGKHYPPLSWSYFSGFNMSKLSEFYYPLFVGSIVLGLIVSVSLYLITRLVMRRFEKRA